MNIIKNILSFFESRQAHSDSVKSAKSNNHKLSAISDLVYECNEENEVESGIDKYQKKHGKIDWLIPIGIPTPNCPYCDYGFKSMPKRKRKCPNCKKVFFSQKRPLDGRKVLLTKKDLLQGWYQEVITSEDYDGIKYFVEMRDMLVSLRKVKYVPLGDILWNVYAELSSEAIRNKKFKIYSEIQNLRSIQREKEGGVKSSLHFHIEYVCLKANEASDSEPYFIESNKISSYNRHLYLFCKAVDMHVDSGVLDKLFATWIRVGLETNNRFKLEVAPEDIWAVYWESYCSCVSVDDPSIGNFMGQIRDTNQS